MRLDVGGSAVRWLARRSGASPRATLAAWAGFLVVCAAGALGLEIETSISNLLDVDSDSWPVYERALERHGSDEFVTVLYRSQEPYDPEMLERVVAATAAFESIDGVVRVDGLASVALIRPGPDGDLDLSPALGDGVPRTASERAELRRAIEQDLLAPGAFISKDGRAVALNLVLDDDVTGERDAVVAAIEAAAGPDAAISGVPIFRTRINADTQRESLLLSPLTCALMALVLALGLRSVQGAVLPLAVGGIGSASAIGALGATGVALSLSTMILPSVLLALGSAYGMHVVAAACGAERGKPLADRIERVVVPVALSGLTTAIGFLAIGTTGIAAIRELALFGAWGVVVETAAAVSFVPAALSLRDPPPRAPSLGVLQDRLAGALAGAAGRHSWGILLAWTVATIVAVVGWQRLAVSTDIVEWYAPESEIRRDYDAIGRELAGITPVALLVEATGERGVMEPEVLAALDALERRLAGEPDVDKVVGPADAIRLMRRALSGEDGLARTREEAEQYLLLLESEDAIWDVVSRDRRSARVAMRLGDNSSERIVEVASTAEKWWRDHGPSDFAARGTGIMAEFARSDDAIVHTQVAGISLALLGVALVLWVVLRSPALALLALLPNAIPIALAYGGMGLVHVPLDAATACLGSLALGIAVDDTVHIATSWSRLRAAGADARDAIQRALREVIVPVVLSSLAIGFGFAVLAISQLGLIARLGVVTAAVVGLCLAADLTLFPALLHLAGRREDARART